jgi:hypothetical protein
MSISVRLELSRLRFGTGDSKGVVQGGASYFWQALTFHIVFSGTQFCAGSASGNLQNRPFKLFPAMDILLLLYTLKQFMCALMAGIIFILQIVLIS